MQVIYIDSLICVNLFIDYLMLYFIKKINHIYSKNWRLIPGALLASISTIAIFLPFYTRIFSIIYRLVVSTITVLTAFGYQNIKKLFVRTLLFVALSMILCGSVLIVELIWNPNSTIIYNDVLYLDISPFLLILSTVTTFFAISIYNTIVGKHKLFCAVRKVTIHMENNDKITFESAVDTGCNLKEPFSGLPVIILENEILEKINIPEHTKRIIPFSTASGSDIIEGFRPKKVLIDGKEVYSGCYIGICKNKLHGEIKSIMGAELSEAIL